MISIVVYGRNDNHGYNLHKRVALSLNCFAEVLTDPNDEIIFVDYNTPDEHPSLIETIQDTLTARAKKYVRVIRAFASVHRHYADKTPFPVVEAIARNIGFRRTNPANRWVLSTNTDMILTPRDTGRSLSAIAADLEDGFYLLPRFELPEAMWELLDRRDPASVIARARDWGTQLALNEVINRPVVRYDAPGDFQLVLRKDLFAMSGMDERMLLGNLHVDSNLCRRAEALRGELRTLVGELFGYHCAHTRTATFVHSRGNVANDFERFVRSTTEWRLPAQADTWGRPQGTIQEIAVQPDGASLFERVLGRAVRPLTTSHDEVNFAYSLQEALRYRLDHMLPYLASAIAPLPKTYSLGITATRGDAVAAIATLWREFGFTGAIGITATAARRFAASGAKHIGALSVVDDAAFTEAFACYLFEFGLASEGIRSMQAKSLAARWAQTDSDALTEVVGDLNRFIPHERARIATNPPRRCFFIGAANNQFEPLVNDNFDVTFTPFTARVRQGNIHAPAAHAAAPKFDPPAIGRVVQQAQGRLRAPSSDEVVQAWSQLGAALRGETKGFEVSALHLALFDAPGVSALLGLRPQDIAAARARLDAMRGSHALAEVSAAPVAKSANALAKFADPLDWENPEWLAHAERFYGGSDIYATQNRHRDVWVGVQILYAMQRLELTAAGRIAVASEHPDDLYAALSQLGGRIGVYRSLLTPPPVLDEAARGGWLNCNVLTRASAVTIADTPLTEAPRGEADAIILARNSVEQNGAAGVSLCLEAADQALKIGGALIIAVDVEVGATERRSETLARLQDLCAGLTKQTGLQPDPISWTLSPDALDRTVDDGEASRPHFVRRRGASLIAPMVLVFRKTRETASDAWRALHDSRTALLFGALAPDMRTNAPYKINDSSVRLAPGMAPGIAVFGPYLDLPAGVYQVQLDIAPDQDVPDGRPLLGVDVVTTQGQVLFQRDVAAAEVRGKPLLVPFEVAPGPAQLLRFEIRLTAFGRSGANVRIGSLERGRQAAATGRTFALMERNCIGSIAQRAGETIVVGRDAPHGHFLTGPYVRWTEGWWQLRLDLSIENASNQDHGVVNLEMLYGTAIVPPLLKLTPRIANQGPLAIDVFVPANATSDQSKAAKAFEFRLLFLGGGDVTVRSFTLASLTRHEAPRGWAFTLDGVLRGGVEAPVWLAPGRWRVEALGARTLSVVAGEGAMIKPAIVRDGTAEFDLPRRIWDGSMRLVFDRAPERAILTPLFEVLNPGPRRAAALAPFEHSATIDSTLYIAAQPLAAPPRIIPAERRAAMLNLAGIGAIARAALFLLRRRHAAIQFDFAERDFDFSFLTPVRRLASTVLWLAVVIAARLRAGLVTVEAHDFNPRNAGALSNILRRALFTLTHTTTGDEDTLAAIRARWPQLARKLRTRPVPVRVFEGGKTLARSELGLKGGLHFVCVGDGAAEGCATVLKAYTLAGRPGTMHLLLGKDAAALAPTANVITGPLPQCDLDLDLWLSAADAVVLPNGHGAARAIADRARLYQAIVIHAQDETLAKHLAAANALSFSNAADLACLLEGLDTAASAKSRPV